MVDSHHQDDLCKDISTQNSCTMQGCKVIWNFISASHLISEKNKCNCNFLKINSYNGNHCLSVSTELRLPPSLHGIYVIAQENCLVCV